jgi:hypothetical protein
MVSLPSRTRYQLSPTLKVISRSPASPTVVKRAIPECVVAMPADSSVTSHAAKSFARRFNWNLQPSAATGRPARKARTVEAQPFVAL